MGNLVNIMDLHDYCLTLSDITMIDYDTVENIVCDVISKIGRTEHCTKENWFKCLELRLLSEMMAAHQEPVRVNSLA